MTALQRECRKLADWYPQKKPLLKSLMKLFPTLWKVPPTETFEDENHHLHFCYVSGDIHITITIGMSIAPIIVVQNGITKARFFCFDKEKTIKNMEEIAKFISPDNETQTNVH